MKTWTILLLRPDYVAATFGHDAILLREQALSSTAALAQARISACEEDEQPTEQAEDYYCLFCCKGRPENLVDGSGGVLHQT